MNVSDISVSVTYYRYRRIGVGKLHYLGISKVMTHFKNKYKSNTTNTVAVSNNELLFKSEYSSKEVVIMRPQVSFRVTSFTPILNVL